jgi:hypothetical protein
MENFPEYRQIHLAGFYRSMAKASQSKIVFLVVFLTLSGGRRISSPSTVGSAASQQSPAAAPTTAQTASENFAGVTGVTEKQSTSETAVILMDVRVAGHKNFDRVVFEFAGDRMPGYRVEYLTRRSEECGSGQPVRVGGSEQILLALSPAKAHNDDGSATIKERVRLPRLKMLQEMRVVCDYEGEVEWLLGLTARRQYRVLELSNPTRLVLDVKHPGR